MSDDLVEKLRWSAASTEVSDKLTPYGTLLDEAAAEIERLRAALTDTRREALETAAENMRVAIRDEWRDGCARSCRVESAAFPDASCSCEELAVLLARAATKGE